MRGTGRIELGAIRPDDGDINCRVTAGQGNAPTCHIAPSRAQDPGNEDISLRLLYVLSDAKVSLVI